MAQRPGDVLPAPPRLPGTNGRPLRHGAAFRLAGERSWPAPAAATATQTTRYLTARAAAWGRLHQQLASRAGGKTTMASGRLSRAPSSGCTWTACPATAARTAVAGSSCAGTSAAEVNRAWQAFLRRFDIEHMFRFFEQVLGGPGPSSGTRPPLTGGPGSSSPAMSSSASPGAWPPTSGCPGSSPARPAGYLCPVPPRVPQYPRRHSQIWPARRNPANPALAARRIEEPPPGHPPRRGKYRQAA